MIKNPCHKCPRRVAGCAIGCPDWDKYVKERDENYKRRNRENASNDMAWESIRRHLKEKQ